MPLPQLKLSRAHSRLSRERSTIGESKQDAIDRGLRLYFGPMCKRGHESDEPNKSLRYMCGRCTKCKTLVDSERHNGFTRIDRHAIEAVMEEKALRESIREVWD